jgi:hypothetical protein
MSEISLDSSVQLWLSLSEHRPILMIKTAAYFGLADVFLPALTVKGNRHTLSAERRFGSQTSQKSPA